MTSAILSVSVLLIGLYTADGLLTSQTVRCVFNSTDPKDIEFIHSLHFNKKELARFSSSVGKFVGFDDIAKRQVEVWNNDTAMLRDWRTSKYKYCVPNIGIFYSHILSKSVPPYVRLRSVPPPPGPHKAMLVCSVFAFFPKHIRVGWRRDGQEVTSGVSSTAEMASADWYYQIHSHLEYTPKSGEKISCVVEHASLRKPLVTDWDPSMPESDKNKIAIGASGLILGLILSLAGFIYYKAKSRGRILVPSS